jgi:DNA polymerase III subunit alpha
MWDLEDMSGIIRCILWPEDFAKHGHLVEADKILALRGVIDKRPGSEEANFIVNELIPLENLESRYTKGIVVRLDEEKHGERGLTGLYEILRGYPGTCEVQLAIALADRTRVILACEGVRVAYGPEMRARVVEFLGEGCFKVQTAEFKPTQQPQRGRGNGYQRQTAGAG